MNRNSLRARITAFYVGMLAVALVFFSFVVYAGVRRYLTQSLERSLNTNAHNVIADYLVPLDSKGQAWFLAEMNESYPSGVSDPFVRVSQGGKVLYDSGDMRDPVVKTANLPFPGDSAVFDSYHRATASTGQPLMIYTVAYVPPHGALIVVETGSSMEPLVHLLHNLSLILLGTTPVILLIAAVGGYLLMAQPLRPVATLTEQTEHVGRKQMGERLMVIRSGDELERLSLALNRMIQRLEEALAHNQRFSADASHELRTPLTILHGELEALLQTPGVPVAAMDGISSALDECERMGRIVHSLMTISRLDGGGESMEMKPLELADVVTGTIEQIGLLAEEKGVQLTCDAVAPIYVTGDAMRLKQVIVNLVDNAIRYTPGGGSIAVRLTEEGQRAVLTVSDTGIGIPANSLLQVFERFYRTDQARSRESGGTGLGLAIVKAICSAHDGSISVASVEGRSTTFRMELPLLHPSAQQLADLELAVKESSAQAHTSPGAFREPIKDLLNHQSSAV